MNYWAFFILRNAKLIDMTIEELDELIKTCAECYSKAKGKKVEFTSKSTYKNLTTYYFRYFPDPDLSKFLSFELHFPTRQAVLDTFDEKDFEDVGKGLIKKIHLNITSLDRQG